MTVPAGLEERVQVFRRLRGLLAESLGRGSLRTRGVNSRYIRVVASNDTLYGALAGPAPIHPRGALAHYRIWRYPLLGPIEGPTVRVKGSAHSVRHRRTHNLTSCPKLADAGRNARTIHQIVKTSGHTDLELFMRQHQERDERHDEVKRVVWVIQEAAAEGRADELHRLLDAHPDLVDAPGVTWEQQTALHKAAWKNRLECVRVLLEHGADVGIRDFGDNAYPLHFAAAEADLAIVRMLVEAGSDVVGEGDDHHLEVLGWATCLRGVREDVAEYLLRAGARLNIWSAIALGPRRRRARLRAERPVDPVGPDEPQRARPHTAASRGGDESPGDRPTPARSRRGRARAETTRAGRR